MTSRVKAHGQKLLWGTHEAPPSPSLHPGDTNSYFSPFTQPHGLKAAQQVTSSGLAALRIPDQQTTLRRPQELLPTHLKPAEGAVFP